MSRKIQIGWEGGNWGAEVLAALYRQISHTVFACAQLVKVSYSSLETNKDVVLHSKFPSTLGQR